MYCWKLSGIASQSISVLLNSFWFTLVSCVTKKDLFQNFLVTLLPVFDRVMCTHNCNRDSLSAEDRCVSCSSSCGIKCTATHSRCSQTAQSWPWSQGRLYECVGICVVSSEGRRDQGAHFRAGSSMERLGIRNRPESEKKLCNTSELNLLFENTEVPVFWKCHGGNLKRLSWKCHSDSSSVSEIKMMNEDGQGGCCCSSASISSCSVLQLPLSCCKHGLRELLEETTQIFNAQNSSCLWRLSKYVLPCVGNAYNES